MSKKNRVTDRIAESVALMGFCAAAPATADHHPPRGPNIDPIASNCNIGPFEKVGKAGPYNSLCKIMEDPEKCFAFVKRHVRHSGEVDAAYNKDKMTYCLDILNQELLIDED